MSTQPPPPPPLTLPPRKKYLRPRSLIQSAILGAVYGVLLRLIISGPKWANSNAPDSASVMTIAFLVLGPIVIGFLTIRHTEAHQPSPVWIWIVLPWASVTLMMAVTALFAIEGAICIAMALPIALVCASLGGVAAGIIARRRRIHRIPTLCLAVLPFLLAPAEATRNAPIQTRTVASEIRIHASPQTVWQNIERVPAISPAELRPTWTHRLGFPRPIEATLSYEGVGGVRHATFERGLTFIETVTAWEPEHRLAFSIKADTANIPSTTLDQHVTIGGRYFDVLDGEYRIEPLPNGDILLHLTSQQRLTTDFNGYAGLWTDAVMQNLQTSILQVIQHRCESQ
jgi:uncharacterized protein YndB with AHSA1/START domain